MVGGDTEAFNTVLPYIEFMGGDFTLCGPSKAGQTGVIDGKLLFETLMTGSAESFVLRNHRDKSIFPDLHRT